MLWKSNDFRLHYHKYFAHCKWIRIVNALSLSIREQRSFVRSVAWFLFCHCGRAIVLCFALVGLILRAISIWRFIRTCVRARFTIVTEMEKKLCWHNGNLLFMARFFFLSVRHFFSPTQLLLAIYSFWLCYCRHGKDKCFTNIFLHKALLLYCFFFTAFIDQASCMDSNECYYLTASSWMKSHTMVHIEMSCKCFLGDFCLCCFCYFTCFALFNEQFA